jgi:hypothetical protein
MPTRMVWLACSMQRQKRYYLKYLILDRELATLSMHLLCHYITHAPSRRQKIKSEEGMGVFEAIPCTCYIGDTGVLIMKNGSNPTNHGTQFCAENWRLENGMPTCRTRVGKKGPRIDAMSPHASHNDPRSVCDYRCW